jgi:phosphoketolase
VNAAAGAKLPELQEPVVTLQPNHRTQSEDFSLLDAWWRAANYISVGQIYLTENRC